MGEVRVERQNFCASRGEIGKIVSANNNIRSPIFQVFFFLSPLMCHTLLQRSKTQQSQVKFVRVSCIFFIRK